jgi:hypothetical protein
MIHAHIKKEIAVPIWAAIGAPLIGVPLMVALLALAGPTHTEPAPETGVILEVEQVDVRSIEQMIDECADDVEQPLRRG